MSTPFATRYATSISRTVTLCGRWKRCLDVTLPPRWPSPSNCHRGLATRKSAFRPSCSKGALTWSRRSAASPLPFTERKKPKRRGCRGLRSSPTTRRSTQSFLCCRIATIRCSASAPACCNRSFSVACCRLKSMLAPPNNWPRWPTTARWARVHSEKSKARSLPALPPASGKKY